MTEEKKMIKDLEVNEEVTIPMLIEGMEERKASASNQPYITFTGKDKTGSLDCKLWGYTMENMSGIKNGDIIMARGTVGMYNDKKQLNMKKNERGKYLFRLTKEEDNLDLNDFIKTSPCPYEQMISEIQGMINNFTNEDFKALCNRFLDKYEDKLKYYPGAKGVHHAYKTGWLYHIYNMMRMGNSLADIYDLNKDLLLTGVLLHDTGKIPAMNSDMNGVVDDFSLEGAMLDHIVLSIKIFNEISSDLDIDKEAITLIEHMIASHHGKLEWGSPVMPMFPEAEALHHLDNMDAKINTMKEHLETVESGTVTDKVYALGRRIYKPNL